MSIGDDQIRWFIERERYQEAVQLSQKALEEAPNDPNFPIALAAAL